MFRKKNRASMIVLSGGGTVGSVSPLLAIVDTLRSNENVKVDYLWLGTNKGPEKTIIKHEGIKFKAIFNGKWRRYFSWQNFIDPFFLLLGFLQSLYYLLKYRAKVIISAGSFASVGVAWAGWVLRIPVIIHQQDVHPGLANKIMAPAAKYITVTFKSSLDDYHRGAKWIGNPVRGKIFKYAIDKRGARQKLGLDQLKPVVLILGGGTGAEAINNMVSEALPQLTKYVQIIHLSGKGKMRDVKKEYKNYKNFDFLHIDGMAKALVSADLVVSRAGMGILTELSYLGKPVILIPIPASHQEMNAALLEEKEAAVVLDEKKLKGETLTNEINKLLNDKAKLQLLGINIKEVIKTGASKEFAKIIIKLLADGK